ncbi:hypothetical protein DMN91_002141 [Ooceraea biroi]|uniref:Proline-rich protein PRCC n=1 Tax=Ooceraea biroi TaxID=2015173 RepID=A0A026WXE2_OOCBI|nr:uncharacterized protein LOC105287922 [Ooceraea biroi]EZA60725.1 Proline-rich protein PRCC [Ooceraea biroi]RLU25978.1 hypothetical protein DMN91_002141 [Ooceraea biroi]
MSLSLVAYDNSDEDSENEENESASTIIASKADDKAIETVTVQTDSKLLLSAPEAISHGTNDREEEEKESNNTKDFKDFLTVLPKPKSFNCMENIEESDDILLKKERKYQSAKPAKKQTIKITVPSLSEFKDIEEESEKEEKPTRIVQPSQKGCGLFALLVPPKKDIKINNTLLIPQTVKNAAAKTNVQQANVSVEAGRSQKNNLKTRKLIADKSHNEFSDDEEDTAMDFFGLTVSKSTLDDSTVELFDSNIEETPFVKHTEDRLQSSSFSNLNVLMSDELDNSSKTLTSNVMNLPKEEILLKNKAEVGPKLPVPEQEYNVDMEGNIAFDEKAIEYLCGKRGVKRKDKEIDEVNIIEINGEDIKPDEREWLVKALTEEPVQRPVSMQSCGINSQSKKKHQITYLAHQAKAMELELKNQWSQNRMTRKQTKSKYGF